MSTSANDRNRKVTAAIALGLGSLLGLAGSFIPAEGLRGLAWGIDGISLTLACALLTLHFYRRGEDVVAAGYLVFAVGQGLVLSTAGMGLSAGAPTFGAGAGLWAAALVLIGLGRVYPVVVRLLGFAAAALFMVTAARIFCGAGLHAKSEPLPFFAYPVFVATMIGWIATLLKPDSPQI